ncbi:tetratricopeptide repeat protein [Candidatus Electronema sp. PJ]|uniref:tetratricopeptide repeat protein n=1 Tax=Candidatus Electronema sp. PJ TaxID=3401572 RepID=UPI003AA9BCA4
MTNHFDSKGGEQNVAQGNGAIGQQNNATQEVRGDGCIFSGTGNVTVNGIPPALFAEYAGKLAVTDSALASFFRILDQEKVPAGDLDSKLREIAATHKELLLRLEAVQSTDPEVVRLKQAARQAIKEAGDYAKAEALLNQAEARDVQAIEQLEEAARQQQKLAKLRRISAAASNADNALLQRVQLRYAKAAEYYRNAAKLLPKDRCRERAYYLSNAAGCDFHHAARYAEALPLHEQSLTIGREIGDRAGEGAITSNIGVIHRIQGDYNTALTYLEQSLSIRREIGDKAGEAVTSWNIGLAYRKQGDLAKAEPYMSRAVQLAEEIGHPNLEEWRTALEDIRAKLRGK